MFFQFWIRRYTEIPRETRLDQKTIRVLDLVHYLHTWRTLYNIADHFNMSYRSAKRYLDTIAVSGYYVEMRYTKKYSYRINFEEGHFGKTHSTIYDQS